MPSTTESQKPQTSSPDTKVPQKSDKKDPGSDANTKQNESKTLTREEIGELFDKAREKNAKMTPEEVAKAYPWLERYKDVSGVTYNEVPDLWDEI